MRKTFLVFIFSSILSSLMAAAPDAVTDLYVWRHGETDSNVLELMSGGGDTKTTLTAKGSGQAHELGKKIARIPLNLEVVYSSDLQRAVQTAEAVLSALPDEQTPAIILSPQLREILHGKYERLSVELRTKKVTPQFESELDKLQLFQKNIPEGIREGTLDRFHFWKIHPLSERVCGSDPSVINVIKFCEEQCQDPEIAYELYRRIYAELARISKESYQLGYREIGVSTHGAVMASLLNVATFSDQSVFIPPHFQQKELRRQNQVVMPESLKISNCALAHFRYHHASGHLDFCGMVE